jgi:CubicO group peptidase (beta-lactamase class C family)
MFRLAALIRFFAQIVSAQSFDDLRGWVQQQTTEAQVPSISVAVVRDGRILWEQGFAWANREAKVPATPDTMYSLASISKPVTATGLMTLAESGKLDLDRAADEYLGPAHLTAHAGSGRDATIRRIASHSAGLPLHVQFFYADEPYRPPAMAETIRRYGILVAPPGERFEYSNLGFGILDYIIARVSGRSYDDYQRVNVFLPLGLTHTSVDVGPGLERFQAARYEDGRPLPFYSFDHRGASAVYASAHDLARFALFHLKAHLADQKAILSDAAIDEMQRPVVRIRDKYGYGIGWFTDDQNGYRTVWHTGGMGGVRNLLLLVPSARLGVVVLCNARNDVSLRIGNRIVSSLLPAWKAPDYNVTTPPRASFHVTPELIGEWQGTLSSYERDEKFSLQVFPSGDIHTQIGDQLPAVLAHVSFVDGNLVGAMLGDIHTEDADRYPHYVRLALKRRGNVFNGSATAVSLPRWKLGNSLTSWVELKR